MWSIGNACCLLAQGRNSSANENVVMGLLNYREMQFNVNITCERLEFFQQRQTWGKFKSFFSSEVLKYNILDNSNMMIFSIYILIYIYTYSHCTEIWKHKLLCTICNVEKMMKCQDD